MALEPYRIGMIAVNIFLAIIFGILGRKKYQQYINGSEYAFELFMYFNVMILGIFCNILFSGITDQSVLYYEVVARVQLFFFSWVMFFPVVFMIEIKQSASVITKNIRKKLYLIGFIILSTFLWIGKISISNDRKTLYDSILTVYLTLVSIFATITLIIIGVSLYKTFTDEFVKKKFILFFIGVLLIYLMIYMNILTALGLTDSMIQVIYTVIIMIPSSLLIYRGFSKD